VNDVTTATPSTHVGDLHRIALKVFLTDDSNLDARDVIPVFHRWIQTQAVDGLLIDVADYTHLPTGPSVLLVAHEGQYALDRTDGRLGLQYTRTRPLEGSLAERLGGLGRTLVQAARLLETDATLPGPVRFAGNEISCVAHDRLLAPNTTATLTAFRPALEAFLQAVSAETDWSLTQEPDAGAPFGVRALASAPATLDTIASRLAVSHDA